MSEAIVVMQEDGAYDEYRTWPIAVFSNQETARLFIQYSENEARRKKEKIPKLFTESFPYYAGSWEFDEEIKGENK